MVDLMAELLELMPHELTAQPGFTDSKDNWIPSGAALAIPCNIEGENMLIRDQLGRDVTATRVVYCGEFNGLTIEDYRFDLPSPFVGEELKALAIDPLSDEDGVIGEIVRFP